MAKAQTTGLLHEFNREFRIRRLAATEAGKRFVPYSVALERLKRKLGQVAAGAPAVGVIARVFDDR
jgi:hypothetical protein